MNFLVQHGLSVYWVAMVVLAGSSRRGNDLTEESIIMSR